MLHFNANQRAKSRFGGARDAVPGQSGPFNALESRSAGGSGLSSPAHGQSADTETRSTDTETRSADTETQSTDTETRSAGTEPRSATTSGLPARAHARFFWADRPPTVTACVPEGTRARSAATESP